MSHPACNRARHDEPVTASGAVFATAAESGTRTNKAENICAAASQLFARHGFDGVTMRDVAEASGVTMAALYYHFSSKEELHDEVAQQRFEEFFGAVSAQWKQCPEKARSPSHMLALIFDAVHFDPTFFLLMQHDLHHFDEGARLSSSRKRQDQFLSLLRRAIKDYQQAEAAETDVYMLAAVITGYCEFVVQADRRVRVSGPDAFIQRHRDTMIRLVQRAFHER